MSALTNEEIASQADESDVESETFSIPPVSDDEDEQKEDKKAPKTFKYRRDAANGNIAAHMENGKLKIYNYTHEEALTAIQKFPHYYELVDNECIIYFDFDFKSGGDSKYTQRQVFDNIKEWQEISVDAVRKACKEVTKQEPILHIATSHGKVVIKEQTQYKFSVHIIVRGCGYASCGKVILEHFCPHVDAHLKDKVPFECDKSVYKGKNSQQCFRTLWSSKLKEKTDFAALKKQQKQERFMYPLNEKNEKVAFDEVDDDIIELFSQYLLSNISGEKLMSFVALEEKNSTLFKKTACKGGKPPNTKPGEMTSNMLRELTGKWDIDSMDLGEYTNWMNKLLIPIKTMQTQYDLNEDECLDIVDKLCERASGYDGRESVEKAYYSIKPNNSITIASIWHNVKQSVSAVQFENLKKKYKLAASTLTSEDIEDFQNIFNMPPQPSQKQPDQHPTTAPGTEPRTTADPQNKEEEKKTNVTQLHTVLNVRDNYIWHDFVKEYEDKTFTSHDEMLRLLRRDLNRVIAFNQQGTGSYVKKDKRDIQDVYSIIPNFKGPINFGMRYAIRTPDREEIKKVKLSKIIRSVINKYSSVACTPRKVDTDILNIWSGPLSQQVAKVNIELIQPMLDFIYEVWANSDQMLYEFLLKWFAQNAQRPHQKTNTALFLYSPQGCGKDTLFEFMRDYVFGRHICYDEPGLNTILQKHNTFLANKQMVMINEMAETKVEFAANFDKLKGLITGNTITIEPKGVNAYSTDNVLNFILCSNHKDAIHIEASDRRYVCLELSTKYRQNVQYFANLRQKCFNRECADNFYSYLMQYQYDPLDLQIAPTTSLKEEIKELSKNSVDTFISELKDQLAHPSEERIIKYANIGNLIPSSELYNIYKVYCDDNNFRPFAIAKFGLHAKTHFEAKKTRYQGKGGTMCFVLA